MCGDEEALHGDLVMIGEWYDCNELALNVSKCMTIMFAMSISAIDYIVGNDTLKHVGPVKDLGIILNSRLTIVPDIIDRISVLLKTLGFIIRNFKSFTLIKAISKLYVALGRSRLEYCFTIFVPMYIVHKLRNSYF